MAMLPEDIREKPVRKFYFNKPQQLSTLIEAREEYAIWGRGTGKSSGLIAARLVTWFTKMPRCLVGLVASTYQQHLTRTLPAIIMGWEKMGFVRDRDFFIGRLAPEDWQWKKPFFTPISTKYFIHWYNGSGMVLISQDRAGSANGLSLDAVAGDEAKLLNYQRFKEEVIPAMRGNMNVFGHQSCYNGILLCTDMPTTPSAEWILEKDHLVDQTRIDLIIDIQKDIAKRFNALIEKDNPCKESSFNQYRIMIQKWEKQLNALRRGNEKLGIRPLTYVSYASSLENIEVLGAEWYQTQKRNSDPFEFNAQILNIKPKSVVNGFYPKLSDQKHGYFAYDNEYLDSLGYDFEAAKNIRCLADADLIANLPLHIAMDFGGSFNCMVVGQRWPNSFKLIKDFWGDSEFKMKDIVLEFKKYYQAKEEKLLYFYYDQTAIGTDASRVERYAEEVIRLLQSDEYGAWAVIPVYIGAQPKHEDRYNMWMKLCTEDELYPVGFEYNRGNAGDWFTSCSRARAIRTARGIEKDKSDEKKRNKNGSFAIAQQLATHLSDAGDTLIYGVYHVQKDVTNSSPDSSVPPSMIV